MISLAFLLLASPNITSGVEGSYWAKTQAVTTSTCVLDSAGGDCALFPAGFAGVADRTVVTIRSDAAAICAWSFDPGETLASDYVIDTAQAAGFRLTGDQDKVVQKPNRVRAINKQSGGYAVGLCSVAHTFQGETLHAPCDADADCSDYGGGTCDASPSIQMERNAGLFLYCLADSGTANISVEKGVTE